MKARGLLNAMSRLEGARAFGSPWLLSLAEDEARSALRQAERWAARLPGPPTMAQEEVFAALEALRQTLDKSEA